MLTLLDTLAYLILTTALKTGTTYHPHFTDEERSVEVKRLADGPTKVTGFELDSPLCPLCSVPPLHHIPCPSPLSSPALTNILTFLDSASFLPI